MTYSKSVQEAVYSSLREDIVTMRLLPGESVSAYEMSEKLGVSRTPVREAFIRLSAESLVEILPQRGTLVSRIDPERVGQERFLRRSLELAAIGPFMEAITRERVGRMRTLCLAHADMMKRGEEIRAMELDDEFHREIYLGAGQTLSWRAVENTNGHYRRLRLMMIRENGEADGVVEEHARIVRAIMAGDADEVTKRDSEHLGRIACREEALREKYPGYFA